jgi:hypothetical protein
VEVEGIGMSNNSAPALFETTLDTFCSFEQGS